MVKKVAEMQCKSLQGKVSRNPQTRVRSAQTLLKEPADASTVHKNVRENIMLPLNPSAANSALKQTKVHLRIPKAKSEFFIFSWT